MGLSPKMIKFMVLFRQPEDVEAFENIYQDFLALVERMPHIQRRQVVHITGSPQGAPEFYRILEIYFESTERQREALMSSIGQEAGQELGRLPSGSFQLLLADVYEEEGGNTPRATPAAIEENEPIDTAADSDQTDPAAPSTSAAASD